MLEYFALTRRGIEAAIRSIMAEAGNAYRGVSDDLGTGAASRLALFASKGKMIRGCMVRLGWEMASRKAPDEATGKMLDRAGAAMELFQSGLLVHDDIMDRDRTRRGSPTIHVEYEHELARGGYDDPQHYGEALGICMGDLAYFAAFEVLAGLETGDVESRNVCLTAARELALVGVAQMQDVANGAVKPASKNPFRNAATEPTEEEILKLYRYKTGRYTFSLPLALGSALAGSADGLSGNSARTAGSNPRKEPRTATQRETLEEAGEKLGIVFQLKDDELGLFANEAELGKPVGSDIREDKKTLFRLKLLERSGPQERKNLALIFGNQDANSDDVLYVQKTIEKTGVRAELQAMMKQQAEEALGMLALLLESAPPQSAAAFRELVAYSLERRS
jgi:geranylgeranyl diphosphate synthase type I